MEVERLPIDEKMCVSHSDSADTQRLPVLILYILSTHIHLREYQGLIQGVKSVWRVLI